MLPKGYVLTKWGCIIPNVYAKLYCYVNIIPYSEVSWYEECNNGHCRIYLLPTITDANYI